jgi:hypothetical protein
MKNLKFSSWRFFDASRSAALLIAALAGFGLNNTTHAAISVGPTGAGPLTFDATPVIGDFATAVLQGTATTFSDVAAMDAGVAAIDVNAIAGLKVLGTSGTEPPSAFSGGFRRHTIRNALMSRPTTDGTNAASLLLATLQNNSGANQATLVLSYDFAVQSSVANVDELPGYHVYYSVSGAPGSWQPIPTLTGSVIAGNVSGILSLGSWPNGSLLYVIWTDDNANGFQDESYTIDNFLVSFGVDPPIITQEPVSISVTQAQTIRLSVVATGIGLQYQWHGPAGPIDPAANPSAATANLVIPNAALTDAGSYHVTVNNSGGGDSSVAVTVTVHQDVLAPALLKLEFVSGNLNAFRLSVNEDLCLDPGVCLAFSGDTFNWQIQDTATFTDLGVNGVAITGTNVEITVDIARTPGVTYRVVVVQGPPDGGVADLFGNFVPFGTFVESLPTVSFQQNVDGYGGTMDTELRGAAADVPQGSAVGITVDADDGGGISHGLLRFENIFGSNPGQVPVGVEIISARLTLNHNVANANGNDVMLHRMLVDWNPADATYNSFTTGIQADGNEAATSIDARIVSTGLTVPFVLNVDVSPTVQAWANGAANYGWALLPSGTDGYRLDSSESATPPALTVIYRVLPCAPIAITQQPTAPATPVIEGGSFSLSVSVSSQGCPPTFQWTKDGADIIGATASSYNVPSAVPGTGVYRVRVSNTFPSSVTSDPVTVTVGVDTIRPVLTRTATSPNGTTITLTFSKPLSAASAQATGNYTFTPALAVNSAVLSADGRTVTLTTAPRSGITAYTLHVQGVSDTRATPNVISPNPTHVALTGVQQVIAWNDPTPWSYATNSQDATLTTATPWFSPAFVPGAEWLTGAGLFGFDDTPATLAALPAPIVTPLTANNVAADPNLFVTAYFRRSINLPALPAGGQYVLLAVIDDGAIFYVDGAPVLTNNMPAAGPYEFITRSTGAAAEGVVQVFPFNVSSGPHTLAVEVHQAGATTSSDVVFGIDIRIMASAGPALRITSAAGTNTVSSSADSSWELTGAATVDGTYAAQAGVTGGAINFAVPAGATNHFYRLRYTGRP